LVDTLEAKDFLFRDRSALEDRRQVWIRLTPRGASVASTFQENLQKVIAARDLDRVFPGLLTDLDVTAAALREALGQDRLFRQAAD
jgi:DNA-binding MarR family transcriptional regulator